MVMRKMRRDRHNAKFAAVVTLTISALIAATAPGHAACGPDAGEVDVGCYNNDLPAALAVALSSDQPLLLSSGTYTLKKTLVIDYASRAGSGFRLISRGARIDGTAIRKGPVLAFVCSGGATANPKDCFYFHEEGSLFVNADTPDYAVRFGFDDFSDAHNSAKIDHLIINNRNQAASASGMRLNYVLNSELFVVADSAGGGAGLELDQVQFSKISGAASAAAGTAMLIRGGYTMSNTIQAIDLEVAKQCLAITSAFANHNTFVSPYFTCPIAVAAVAGASNLLLNPLYAGTTAPTPGSQTGIISLP
jgi:hypothetical protein